MAYLGDSSANIENNNWSKWLFPPSKAQWRNLLGLSLGNTSLIQPTAIWYSEVGSLIEGTMAHTVVP